MHDNPGGVMLLAALAVPFVGFQMSLDVNEGTFDQVLGNGFGLLVKRDAIVKFRLSDFLAVARCKAIRCDREAAHRHAARGVGDFRVPRQIPG
jgi:hypothetical protein